MAEAKTKETQNSVIDFIKKIEDEQKQKDALELLAIMENASGFKAKMWGPSIIGFGSYHYVYESGHKGDAPLVGFSPRKAAFSLYVSCKFDGHEDLLKDFGKHSVAKACIYFKKMSDINPVVLKKMIVNSVKYYQKKFPSQ